MSEYMYSEINSILYNVVYCFVMVVKWLLIKFGLCFNIDTEYYLAKCVWCCQYMYTRYHKLIHDNSKKNIFESIEQPYIVVKSGDYTKLRFPTEYTENYDMILYEFFDSLHCKNIVRLNDEKLSDIKSVNDKTFEISNVKFLGIKFYIYNKKITNSDDSVSDKEENNEYEIDLGNENFYVVGNTIFDRVFVEYWLKRFHGVTLLPQQTYKVTFFDNNISECILEEPKSITLYKDTYIINGEKTDSNKLR